MAKPFIKPTGVESPFNDDELIVSKTNLKGQITYANDVFLRVSKYPQSQLIGAPHSLVRHPDMPRSVFKLLWDTIQAKRELFAYIINMASNGDHYWVYAHVTPSLDANQNVIGFHSNRRKPNPDAVSKASALYRELRQEENRHDSRKDGMLRGYEKLMAMLKEKGAEYDEFVFSL